MVDDIRQDNNLLDEEKRRRKKNFSALTPRLQFSFSHLTLRIAKLARSSRREDEDVDGEKEIPRVVICLEAYGS